MITTPSTDWRWRKSTYTGNNGGDCVEVAGGAERIPVRDSKARAFGHITVTPIAWSSLIAELRTA